MSGSGGGSWFEELESRLEDQLEAFLRRNPEQRHRLERQERQERRLCLERRRRDLTATAERQRGELIALAEEIRRWSARVERAREAGADDLADRAASHLMGLMGQGRERWQALGALGRELARVEETLSSLDGSSAGDGDRQPPPADDLEAAWSRFEADRDLEELRTRSRRGGSG
jgi:hercynine metabolism protein